MDEKTKFGIIASILDRLGEKRLYYGTVVAQKIMYFLQEAFSVGLDYHFYFYHYGPYADGLDRDLKIMEMYEIISIGYDPKKIGYSIRLEPGASAYIDSAKPMIERYFNKINKVIGLFGDFYPADLELLATIHYVNRNNKNLPKATRIAKVQKLKPKFGKNSINRQYTWLEKKGLLN